MRSLHCLLLLISVAGALHPPAQKASRLPLQKKRIVLEAPKDYAQRVSRHDKSTGETIYYDPKPQVVLVDEKSGKYAFKWIGYDGQEKTVIYQRPDAIDAVVNASASRTPSGKYLYIYHIKNLPSSGQYLSGFAVQSFSSDVKPERIGDGYVGEMSKDLPGLGDGNWVYFGSSNFGSRVIPSQSIKLKLEASAPPGTVECRITGGIMKMFGVGEDMPQELENVLPGYEAWPSGFTIGPVDKLKSFTVNRHIKYLRSRLSLFQRLGWIAVDSVAWYEQNLRGNNLEAVYRRADEDLKAGRITTEILVMIKAIRR